MAHSNSPQSSNSSPSKIALTIATTMVCQGVALGTSSVMAQASPSADASSNVNLKGFSSPTGLNFALPDTGQASQPVSGSFNPVASTLPSSPSLPSYPLKAASSDSLSFALPPAVIPTPAAVTATASSLPPTLESLFVGNTHSLVAIAIGCAEGTRTPDGGKTWAFKGHTDPGNGVWNLGTFSWQHGANSPEEADQKQLARLRRQAETLNRQAIALGVPWGLEEQLNALDLANQSPSAALNKGGFLERLKQAHADGLRGYEAILWARTWSYRHPSGTRWNAPGLGNTHHGIRTDQKRRMDEIAKAIAAYSNHPTSPNPAAPNSTQPSIAAQPHLAPVSTPPSEASPGKKRLQQRAIEEAVITQLLSVEV